MTSLTLTHLSHRYGRIEALSDVNLEVAPGEILALLGPSGCGKSTLLRLAAGLEEIQTGRIKINGHVVSDGAKGLSVPPEQRDVGMVFQDFALFPHLTVRDNVAFGLSDGSAKQRDKRAETALAQVGMEDYADAYPHTLSGGQQQRVALARALCPRPKVMLLDEPFSGLDSRLRHRLAAETWHLLKESGTTSVVVTHDPEEAMFLADRIAVLHRGRLEQVDTPEAIFTKPGSPFVTRFFSDVNEFSGTIRADGHVETPWGDISGAGLDSGTEAHVLIRFDAVRLLPPKARGNLPLGFVHLARPLGGHGLVELTRADAKGGDRAAEDEPRLFARVHWDAMPEMGETVAVEIDPRQTFVFPARPAT